MISLDQVILLEKKVESAVAKIQQLKAENDALRNKCSELTNALSAKSEQLSSFVSDQSQIEDGIRKALDRLNSIENSVLKSAATIESDGSKPQPVMQQATFQDLKPVAAKPVIQQEPAKQPEQPKVQFEPEVEESPVISTRVPEMFMEEPEEEMNGDGFAPDPADEIFDQPIGSFAQNYSEEIPEEKNLFASEETPDDFGNPSDEQTDLGFDIF